MQEAAGQGWGQEEDQQSYSTEVHSNEDIQSMNTKNIAEDKGLGTHGPCEHASENSIVPNHDTTARRSLKYDSVDTKTNSRTIPSTNISRDMTAYGITKPSNTVHPNRLMAVNPTGRRTTENALTLKRRNFDSLSKLTPYARKKSWSTSVVHANRRRSSKFKSQLKYRDKAHTEASNNLPRNVFRSSTKASPKRKSNRHDCSTAHDNGFCDEDDCDVSGYSCRAEICPLCRQCLVVCECDVPLTSKNYQKKDHDYETIDSDDDSLKKDGSSNKTNNIIGNTIKKFERVQPISNPIRFIKRKEHEILYIGKSYFKSGDKKKKTHRKSGSRPRLRVGANPMKLKTVTRTSDSSSGYSSRSSTCSSNSSLGSFPSSSKLSLPARLSIPEKKAHENLRSRSAERSNKNNAQLTRRTAHNMYKFLGDHHARDKTFEVNASDPNLKQYKGDKCNIQDHDYEEINFNKVNFNEYKSKGDLNTSKENISPASCTVFSDGEEAKNLLYINKVKLQV